ncbi:hypothetical protein BU26DRAFT_108397 [Trematosphaeria pertusa]|uniref:Uncharacterized protein n=1 Tax=Trematosphaeria pertusa TaxID=390896 RepID=A0A6A6HZT1_9PLEO|nr:uncharacterized protein BU26DRAFT_108397 [Trematosphaeria pertusa]KAF2243744.1 hypothetical protein BU26DRAFT_108397 [Trematosphaeria pertusa]
MVGAGKSKRSPYFGMLLLGLVFPRKSKTAGARLVGEACRDVKESARLFEWGTYSSEAFKGYAVSKRGGAIRLCCCLDIPDRQGFDAAGETLAKVNSKHEANGDSERKAKKQKLRRLSQVAGKETAGRW